MLAIGHTTATSSNCLIEHLTPKSDQDLDANDTGFQPWVS